MPNTPEALGIFVLAVLPGALYIWAFEREAGRWGIGLADRVLRFVAVSAFYLLLFAWPIYELRAEFWHHQVIIDGEARFENQIAAGQALPWWLFFAPVIYLGVPVLLGTLAAAAVRGDSRLARQVARVFAGRNPAPRGWDALFSPRPSAVVRMRTDKGDWLGGLFGEESYASGYPEEPQDILLEQTYRLSADGEFLTDAKGEFESLGSRLLVRWQKVDFLEVFPIVGFEEE